jgi:hypothetical protein
MVELEGDSTWIGKQPNGTLMARSFVLVEGEEK